MNVFTQEVAFAHPAESVFDIEPGTTMVDRAVVDLAPIETPIEYDLKDTEIDDQFQQVFSMAVEAFETQRMASEGLAPQFANRSLEVAAQFLSTALAAANSKAQFKSNKDKTKKLSGSTINTTTNNTLVMSRAELLGMIRNNPEVEVLEDVNKTPT